MKAIRYIIFLLLVICSSCSIKGQKLNDQVSLSSEVGEKSRYHINGVCSPKDSIYAELNEKCIKTPITSYGNIKLTIYNHTDIILCTANFNAIEKCEKGEWKTPKKKESISDSIFAVEGSPLFINPHEKKEVWFSFYTDRYEYSIGKYRIKKPIWLGNSTETKFIYSYFEIIE